MKSIIAGIGFCISFLFVNSWAQDTFFSLKNVLSTEGFSEVQLSRNSMGIFEIEVRVNDSHTLLLAVDNTSASTYFDKHAIEKLKFAMKNSNKMLMMDRKKLKIFTFDIKDLLLGDAHTGPMTLEATDLSSRNDMLVRYGNKPLDGYLGLDILTRYSAIIDLQNQKLYLRIK